MESVIESIMSGIYKFMTESIDKIYEAHYDYSSCISPNEPTHFKFDDYFNLNVGHKDCMDINCPKNLPSYIRQLTFGRDFNKTVDKLPSKLTHLSFGWYFNQRVDNLPSTLTNLVLGASFNKKIDNLPSSLTELTLGAYFNNVIDNLPPALTHLIFIRNSFIKDFIKKTPFDCTIIDKDNGKITRYY